MKPYRPGLGGLLKGALLTTFLVSCSAPPTAAPIKTPEPLVVTFTASLRPLAVALQHCALQQPEIALVVDEIPATQIPAENSAFSIRLGLPPGDSFYNAALGVEQIVVILNQANPQDSLDKEQLGALFTGVITDWEGVGDKSGPVHPWTYLPGDDARQIFDAAILDSQDVASQATLASDPAAMIRGIASDPWAIGYMPHAWITETVRALTPQDLPADSLRQPILAASKTEPEGAGRAFLACLQSGSGQDMLRENYFPFNGGG